MYALRRLRWHGSVRYRRSPPSRATALRPVARSRRNAKTTLWTRCGNCSSDALHPGLLKFGWPHHGPFDADAPHLGTAGLGTRDPDPRGPGARDPGPPNPGSSDPAPVVKRFWDQATAAPVDDGFAILLDG